MDSDNPSKLYLDGHALVPDLKKLISQITGEGFATPDYKVDTLDEFELLPYCLGATSLAYFEYLQAHNDALLSVEPNPQSHINLLGIGGEAILSHKVDNYLEAAIRTQDATTPYFRRRYDLDNKTWQFDKFEEKVRDNQKLPENVKKEISSYLENHGRKLREYRNLSQHQPLITSDVQIWSQEGQESLLYLLLPNNPQARKPKPLVYGNPEIHALEYMRRNLYQLIRFCSIMCQMLLIQTDKPTPIIGIHRLKNTRYLNKSFQGIPTFDLKAEQKNLHLYVNSKGSIVGERVPKQR